MTTNPYAAPRAQVADPGSAPASANFLAGGRGVSAGRGWSWIADAWPIFRAAPGIWIGGLLVFFALLMVAGLVPFVGTLVSSALWPMFLAGFASAARTIDRGNEAEFHEFFAGFRERFGPLIVLGLISLAISVGVFLAVFAVMGVGLFSLLGGAGEATPEAMVTLGVSFVLAVLVAIALLLPLMMATWFAPLLIMFHEMAPLDAMKASFSGCLKNLLAFLVYSVVLFFAAILASLPLFLGWLVLGPLMLASVYTAYRDIYFAA